MARMRLTDILLLYRARLRARAVLVQELFAVLGLSVGVALLFASQVSSTSLNHSVTQLTSEVVGNNRQLQLVARGPNGFDEKLLRQVGMVPGVQSALPVLEQQANVIGPHGRASIDLIGTDPRFAHSAGPLLRRFSAAQLASQRAIALPGPIARQIGVGSLETIKLQVGARVVQSLLGATLSEADIGGLVHSPIALAPVAYAQSISGMTGRITRIFVHPAPGRESDVKAGLTTLAKAAGANLEAADFDSKLFSVASGPEHQGETLFSAISALVGFMFALNAMLVTVPARRKLIEDIRPQGASRLMTVQILLFDAAVLGVLASIAGLILGDVLSVAVFRSTPGYLSSAFPVGNDRIVMMQSVVLAIAAGIAASILGVLWPLRNILARPLQGEEKPRHLNRVWVALRLTGGLICLLITTEIVVDHPQDAVFGNFTLVIALVCVLPYLFDGIVIAFERAQRIFNGASPILAVTELQTPPTRIRSLAIAATAAVAVFGTVAIDGAQHNLQHGLEDSIRGIDSGSDLWVTPRGESSLLTTTPFKSTAANSLRSLNGVASVGSYRGSFLDWGKRRLWILAPAQNTRVPIPPTQLVGGDLMLASRRMREGGWAVLSQALANEHRLEVGQRFTLPAPRPVSLRVAALSTNLGWPPGAIVVDSGDYAHAWMSEDPSAYQVQITPDVLSTTVRQEIQRALGPQTGLQVETTAEREQRHYAFVSQGLSRLTQIRLLVLIAAILAVAGAMGSMMWQRRDLVSFIKCQGYARGVLWRWLLCESALLLGAGCSIGAVFGLYGQLLISHALASVTGFPVLYNIEALIALSSFALVSVIALAIVAMAGFLVVRVPPRTVSPAY